MYDDEAFDHYLKTSPDAQQGMKDLTALSEPERAKLAGVIFYELPANLTPEQVDPLLQKAVFRINESGWVWTAESCQGHPDATENSPWAFSTRPMLRLVCRESNLGKMLALLSQSMRYKSEFGMPNVLSFMVHISDRTKGAYEEVLVYIQAATAYERNLGVAAYERFAELVNS